MLGNKFALAILLACVLPLQLQASDAKLKPIIGISIDNGAHPAVEASKLGMIEAIQKAGGIPLILNDRINRSPEKDIGELDGLVVQGDVADVDPAMYGQKKDKTTQISTDKSRTDYENKIIVEALHDKVPVLLICGGMQRANVLMGGTLHQNISDLPGVKPGHLNNRGNSPDMPSVTINIKPDSQFRKILGAVEIKVNSFHHQALDKVANGFRVVAYSDAYTRADGSKANLVEAIEEAPDSRFANQYILGLQFHPELMPDNTTSDKIFGNFTHAAQAFALDTRRTHQDEEILRKVNNGWEEHSALE